ncbi:DUF997 family protein [Zophobihabitans entericus]|uniref:DUF997 family protein n=1 Tax=Zophobihabitans entericus TaxID=1635327 RepID=A0A6G9IAC9_9GAMM|nr:DUF997 family protein [Zophobihabitans entericus]QIQ21173.1 DUF997 family protein [Zophobihabitans entericus]
MDKRYLQANKEAVLSLLLTILYLLAWLITAYCLGSEPGITGLPLWFEVSCVFVPLGFVLACYIAVRFKFKNISLEPDSQ